MKKFSQLDFEMWGRQAATSYLEDNEQLNDSIVKIAEDNQLNGEQVKRIVEEANNQVYLQKFAAEKDKYIEFAVADAATIGKSRTELNKLDLIKSAESDYCLRPSEHKLFDVNGKLGGCMIKTAELEEPTEGERNKMIFEAQGIQDQFETKMNTLSQRFEEKVAELKTSFETSNGTNHLKSSCLGKFISEEYGANGTESKLANHIVSEFPNEKVAEDETSKPIIIDENHNIYGLLKEAVVIGKEYSENYDKGPDTSKIRIYGSRNEKTAQYAGKVENALWKFLIAAGLVGGTATAAHKAGFEKGKKVQAIKMSPMRKLPETHNPRGR